MRHTAENSLTYLEESDVIAVIIAIVMMVVAVTLGGRETIVVRRLMGSNIK